MLFDAYLMVDWSASSVPKRGADSIWYALLLRDGTQLREAALANPPTRAQAADGLGHVLAGLVAEGRRTLCGFDFPNAYSAGFAAAAGFAGEPWRAVRDGIAGLVEDAADNRNNRFAVAAELNRRVSGARFPFWNCPPGHAGPHLGPTKPAGYGERFAERRLCEAHVPRAQPCWKLYTTGSVGGQALLGIPVQRALALAPELGTATRTWPFETGFGPPDDGRCRIVLAEVYPSLWPEIARPALAPGEVKDAAQVRLTARRLAERDLAGRLSADLAGPPLDAARRRVVEREEGWILGAGTAQG